MSAGTENSEPQSDTPAATVVPLAAPHTLICDREQITQILQQLLVLQTRLNIQLLTSEGQCHSHTTLLRLDLTPAPGQVILHQPAQADWYRLLQDEPGATIACCVPDGRLVFTTRLAPLENLIKSSFFCRFPLPAQIRRYQQRASYRVSLTPGNSMVVVLLADQAMGGECRDFSIGGCCLILHRDPALNLAGHSPPGTLVVNLADMANFAVSVKVCRTSIASSGQVVIGAQYLGLTVPQQNQLQAALARIQRAQLQQKPRLR